MDLKRIKELIDLFANSDLAELNIREGDCQLHLARRSRAAVSTKSGTCSAAPEIPPQPTMDASEAFHPAATETAATDNLEVTADGREVLAPMHGVLHLAPDPGALPFVKVGEKVLAGQTLGVLEAMKVFHSLKSDTDGIISAVMAPSGSEVAAGQPLFRII